ncbi:MAG TPA: hypothetical protein VFU31_30500 [Candidatus Binatia bacterium]|nr:hypothetical protein [Candidatus Binatia bacterium]
MGTPSESQENDALLERMARAAADLKEHVDSVRIFCTLHRDDTKNTVFLDAGKGNWYAQFGQIVEWVEKEKQRARNEQTKGDESSDE